MAIPSNITREHLLKAIEKIDQEGIPSDGQSRYYDLIYNGNKYPPKVIVSYANVFVNGKELDRNSFAGGLEKQSFKLLEENGFVINKKNEPYMSFYDELKKFLAQVRTGKLGTASYLNNYRGLKVSVSFGKGNQARIPWIAFLNETQTVQEGIYPVYLFYKDKNLLVLAYGVSETNRPMINWNLSNSKTIEEYFRQKNLDRPERYRQSFVFRTYNTNEELNKDEIDKDLSDIINFYKQISFTQRHTEPEKSKELNLEASKENSTSILQEEFDPSVFYEKCITANFLINEKVSVRFVASLLTKPFVILTGLSGSGKTKLAQAFAMWICENENQYCIVPVGADWTNREPLLGFPNALKNGEYIKPDNRVLDLIIDASSTSDKPYFLILDEMNLSHVERYFADFLSVMETNGKIYLHAGNESWNKVPSEINVPKNLFIIGTVNIDETTYMFSPKVLDRANVIEFSVDTSEMEDYLENSKTLDLNFLKSTGAYMALNFVNIATSDTMEIEDKEEMNKALISFFVDLKKISAEFGYRSVAEILRFASVINRIDSSWTITHIVDAAIMQKLLPKVHGSRRKLEPVLKALGTLCINNVENFEDYISPSAKIDFDDFNKIRYPISLEKILRMYRSLINNGFTSYAEA